MKNDKALQEIIDILCREKTKAEEMYHAEGNSYRLGALDCINRIWEYIETGKKGKV